MKSKSLINIALIGLSCIAVSVSFLMGAKTHQDDFSLVRSQGNEYTLTYTANDFYQIGCFNDADNRYTNQFAFFPLKYSGNLNSSIICDPPVSENNANKQGLLFCSPNK